MRARFATSPGAHTGYVHRQETIPSHCSDWAPPTFQSGHCRGRLSDKACPPRAGSRRPHLQPDFAGIGFLLSCMDYSSAREAVMTFWMLLLVIVGPSLIGLGIRRGWRGEKPARARSPGAPLERLGPPIPHSHPKPPHRLSTTTAKTTVLVLAGKKLRVPRLVKRAYRSPSRLASRFSSCS